MPSFPLEVRLNREFDADRESSAHRSSIAISSPR